MYLSEYLICVFQSPLIWKDLMSIMLIVTEYEYLERRNQLRSFALIFNAFIIEQTYQCT